MNFVHVAINNLQGEILLAGEMMIEGSLRHARFLEHCLDTEIVVAVAEKHAQPCVEYALLAGIVH